ncbi:MAG: hypothetical protein GY937_01365 [bacterium]|nr:hypothetical protein [bacterium]
MTTTTHTYLVCDECAAAVENDDWTHLDHHVTTPEESEEIYAEHTASAESMGNATLTQYLDNPTGGGYWECYVCSHAQLGRANLYSDQ